jgi:lysophospholipase L1-like esterase
MAKARFLQRRIALLSIFIALALGAEVSLRIFLGLGNPPLFQRDLEIGYLMVANQETYRRGGRIKINAFHQRSEDLALRPSDGVTRILFLGDSITFGVTGVDQTQIFSELVGTALRTLDWDVEIMNASAASWGIGNELAYVRRFGTFGSKIAVLQIGSGDLLQPTSTGDGVGMSASQPDRKPFSATGELFARVLLPRLAEVTGVESRAGEPSPSERDRQFKENMQHFTELVMTVRQNGSLPIVIMIPSLSEMRAKDDPTSASDENYPSRFREHAKQLAVPFVDMSKLWLGDPSLNSYYTDGTHLTAAGNQALSVTIVEAIRGL